MDRHYIGSVTATTHQEKGIMTLESNPSRGTALPAPHGRQTTFQTTKEKGKSHIALNPSRRCLTCGAKWTFCRTEPKNL